MKYDGMQFRSVHRHYSYRVNADGYCEFLRRRDGKLVPLKGHSLTNMAYAEDGRVFLAHGGGVYTAGKITKAVKFPEPEPVVLEEGFWCEYEGMYYTRAEEHPAMLVGVREEVFDLLTGEGHYGYPCPGAAFPARPVKIVDAAKVAQEVAA